MKSLSLVLAWSLVLVLSAAGALAADLVEGEPGPTFIAPAEAVGRRALPLEVADPNGVARMVWPVSGGVPIPRGELRDAGQVRVLDAAGKEIPVQTEVLGWWPEVKRETDSIPASVMWLGVTFLGDVPANGKAMFTLEYGTQVKPAAGPSQPVRVTRAGDAVTLSNGLVSLKLAKAEKFIESIALEGKDVLSGAGTSMTTDLSYTGQFADVPPVVTLPHLGAKKPDAAAAPPKIDGQLDDPAWSQARKVALSSFRLAEMLEETTEARMMLDDEFLYIAIDCKDRDPAAITAPERKRDDAALHQDDHVEIWLDAANAESRGFVEISVSASGAVYDRLQGYERVWKDGERKLPTNAAFNIPGLKAATARTATGWTAEIAIPLNEARLNWSWTGKSKWHYNGHSLADKEPHTNTFGVQICRYRPARKESGVQETRWPMSLYYDNQRPGKFARIPEPGPEAKDWDGLAEKAAGADAPKERVARVEVREVVVETEGPVVSIARVRGMYHHGEGYGSPFTVRAHLYAGRKDFRLQHTMTAGFPSHGERMKSVSLDLPVTGGAVGVEGRQSPLMLGNGSLVQATDDSYALIASSDGAPSPRLFSGKLAGTVHAQANGAPLTVASRHFWQMYPGGYRQDDKTLHVDMYSPHAQPLYFGVPGAARDNYGDFERPGDYPQRVSRTHEIWLDLSGGEPAEYVKEITHLLLPFAGAKWNCDSLAMGHIAPYDRTLLPRLEDWMDYQLWWFVNEQRAEKWYGWGNFGNTLNTFTGRGVGRGSKDAPEIGYIFEGGYGWANDRKGVSLNYLTQYFRSGRRIWFDFGEQSTRCGTDITTSYPVLSDENWKPDLKWVEEMKVTPWREPPSIRPVCKPRRHWQMPWHGSRGSAARQGGQPGWVMFYFLTGDRRTRDVIEMHELHITTPDLNNWTGGGMDTSSPHGTRAQERRFLMLRWIMTNDPIFRTLVEGFHKHVYADTLEKNTAVISLRYPWFVLPEQAWMWEAQKEIPAKSNSLETGIAGMHVELGGWDAPVRMHEITGDPWLAKVIFKLAGAEPEVMAAKANAKPGWTMLYESGYGRPLMREADMLRWTGKDAYLARLTGYPSPEEFAAGRETRSPVRPAEPEKPIDRQELFEESMKFDFGAGGVFPATYLWPTNNYYMTYALYPLQKIVRENQKK